MNKSSELRQIAKSYAEELLLETLQESKFFVVASGSVGYGFADEFSDIELEIYCQDKNLHTKIQDIIDENHTFMNTEMSADITGWPVEKLLNGNYQIEIETNPNTFFELKNATPIVDPENLFEQMQSNLGFYNSNDKKIIVRGLYLQIFELGLHISNKLTKRKLYLGAEIAFYSSIEALLRLVHILNDEFFPHTKWLWSNLINLKNDYSTIKLCNDIESVDDITTKVQFLVKYIEEFKKEKVFEQFLSESEIYSPWSMIEDKSSYKFFNTINY